jgi:hypothetical protein
LLAPSDRQKLAIRTAKLCVVAAEFMSFVSQTQNSKLVKDNQRFCVIYQRKKKARHNDGLFSF